MRLTLIRHGQSLGNAEGILQGQKDYPLSEQGKLEAIALGEWLAHTHIDAVYSSDLTRAVETANEIVKHHQLPVIKSSILREVHFGPFQGLTRMQIEEMYPHQANIDWLTSGIDGIESIEQINNRVRALLQELLQKHVGERVVAVSHGGFISHFLMALLNIDWKGKRIFAIGNTSITTIDFTEPKKFVIVSVNEAPHLARQKIVDTAH